MQTYLVVILIVGLVVQAIATMAFWTKWRDAETILAIRTKDVDRLAKELEEYRDFRRALLEQDDKDKETITLLNQRLDAMDRVICPIRTLIEEYDELQGTVLEREED